MTVRVLQGGQISIAADLKFILCKHFQQCTINTDVLWQKIPSLLFTEQTLLLHTTYLLIVSNNATDSMDGLWMDWAVYSYDKENPDTKVRRWLATSSGSQDMWESRYFRARESIWSPWTWPLRQSNTRETPAMSWSQNLQKVVFSLCMRQKKKDYRFWRQNLWFYF